MTLVTGECTSNFSCWKPLGRLQRRGLES